MNAFRIVVGLRCGLLNLAVAVMVATTGDPPSPWYAPTQIAFLWLWTAGGK